MSPKRRQARPTININNEIFKGINSDIIMAKPLLPVGITYIYQRKD